MAGETNTCPQCDVPIAPGEGWYVGPLPWLFCTVKCGGDYYGKDGTVPENARPRETKCLHTVSIDTMPPYCGQCGAEDPWSKPVPSVSDALTRYARTPGVPLEHDLKTWC